MNTQQPQIARPTSALATPAAQSATQSSNSIQSKPAFIPAKPAAAKPVAAAKPAAKKAAPKKKAAAPAPKKKTTTPKKSKSSAKKPAANAAKPASQPAANSNKSAASSAPINTLAGKAVAESNETIKAVIECGNKATEISKSIGAEISKIANSALSQNAQAFKQLLGCKTATDFVNVSNSLIRSQADSAYSTSLKLVELVTQFTKVSEPLNARVAAATQSIAKNVQK